MKQERETKPRCDVDVFSSPGPSCLCEQMARPERSHLEEHYADLSGKGFFAGLIDYMVSPTEPDAPTLLLLVKIRNAAVRSSFLQWKELAAAPFSLAAWPRCRMLVSMSWT